MSNIQQGMSNFQGFNSFIIGNSLLGVGYSVFSFRTAAHRVHSIIFFHENDFLNTQYPTRNVQFPRVYSFILGYSLLGVGYSVFLFRTAANRVHSIKFFHENDFLNTQYPTRNVQFPRVYPSSLEIPCWALDIQSFHSGQQPIVFIQ
jgi:hypothetical protein